MRTNDDGPFVVPSPPAESTFHDTLYDWMDRAPWVLLSAAAHLLVFFVLVAIPWEWLDGSDEVVIASTIDPVPPELFEEQVELPVEVVEPSELEEPVLKESDDPTPDPEASPNPQSASEPGSSDAIPTDDWIASVPIGPGPGGGAAYRGRFGKGRGKGRGGHGTPEALEGALRWLKDHQSPGGFWDGDGFMDTAGAGPCTCDGEGYPSHDVGLTGLAVLAFLGNGNTADFGPYRDVVARGVHWLDGQQDPDTGLIGDTAAAEFLYDHAIATLALSEAYYFSRSPRLRQRVERAVAFIQGARAPYGGWRYDAPSLGDYDTSMTGWMLFALSSAKSAGLAVDASALSEGLGVIDEFTDPATGRVGYDARGSLSSRTAANRDTHPREKGEALTAVGLLCRIFLADEADDSPARRALWNQHAELLRKSPPRWEPGGGGSDMYYWYYGTYAMFQMGGRHWSDWKGAMERAVLASQRKDGDAAGSWDPTGPWGYAGGRVYSTAMMALCLEVYYRYGRVLGGR